MDIQSLDIISAAEAAQLLKVGIRRFNRLVVLNNIPHKRLSCGKIFLKSDIENFKENRKLNQKHRRKMD